MVPRATNASPGALSSISPAYAPLGSIPPTPALFGSGPSRRSMTGPSGGSASREPPCYFGTVALRYVLLAVGAVSVLGVSVYLALEVRGRPARAQAPELAPAAREEAPQPPPAREREPAGRTVAREPPRGP